MTTDQGGWTMVYKVSNGVGGDIYNIWLGRPYNENDASLLNLNHSKKHYLNQIVSYYWNTHGFSIKNARVALYTKGKEVAFLKFAINSSSKTGWFALGHLITSTWTDIKSQPHNYFSIYGHRALHRHWFIERNYGGCGRDTGWLVVFWNSGCTWEARRRPHVSILYSARKNAQNWNNYTTTKEADIFTVFVR